MQGIAECPVRWFLHSREGGWVASALSGLGCEAPKRQIQDAAVTGGAREGPLKVMGNRKVKGTPTTFHRFSHAILEPTLVGFEEPLALIALSIPPQSSSSHHKTPRKPSPRQCPTKKACSSVHQITLTTANYCPNKPTTRAPPQNKTCRKTQASYGSIPKSPAQTTFLPATFSVSTQTATSLMSSKSQDSRALRSTRQMRQTRSDRI